MLRESCHSDNASALLQTLLERTQELTPNTHDFSPAHDGNLRRVRSLCGNFARAEFLGHRSSLQRREFRLWRLSVRRNLRECKPQRQHLRDELSVRKPKQSIADHAWRHSWRPWRDSWRDARRHSWRDA